MPKSNIPAAARGHTQAEALSVARSIQKPGQSKEQTKLIAQGIAKGIDHYKRQQNAKVREKDKAYKRLLKTREVASSEPVHQMLSEPRKNPKPLLKARVCLSLGGSLCGLMAAVHLIRVLAGWQLSLGNWTITPFLSLVVMGLFAGFSVLFFYSAHQNR
ncbi:MAG: DUF2956 family protein [Methylococcaceae bacterium]|jgi:hypothetical protein